METRVYIGNLAKETTAEELRALFSAAGTVVSVELPMNPKTEKSRGFAFVTLSSAAEAENAVEMFNEKDINGQVIRVNISLPRVAIPVSGSENKP